MTPVRALLEILRDEGVRHIFGNPGTTELPLLDALAEAPDLHYVLGLQEASVVAMADGYARATGRPAVASLHVAAGLANGLIGLLNAARSRTPLVVLAGQQDRRHLLEDPMLSGDLVGLARPVCKSAIEVHQAYDLPLVLRRAFAEAVRPPTGPVFVSVPMDLLAEEQPVTLPERSVLAGPGPAPGLERAVYLLAGAASPVIVAGDGVGRDGAIPELVRVAERLGAPVHHQPMHDGVNFPGSHRLLREMLPPRNAAIRSLLAPHDVILIVGCHAFMPHHYTPGSAIPASAAVVQLDVDPAELGRNFPVAAGLVGPLGPTLAALADRLPDRSSRGLSVALSAAAARAAIDGQALQGYGRSPLDPLAAMHALAAGLPPEAVVVEEAITAGIALRSVLRLDRPRSYVHTVGGGLGWGIGAAIGTGLGDPDRPVVAVLGDGCAMFGLQGLWSAVRYQVPVTFAVVNNGEYRTLKDTLASGGSRPPYVGLDLPGIDWAAAAATFGLAHTRIGDTDELREVVGRPRSTPLLVEIPVTGHPG